MTAKEFYERIHGSYEDVLKRLPSDELILRFVGRFPSDTTYAELMNALKGADFKAGFAAAHTLKGLTANLAFTELSAVLSELTEQLRAQTEPINSGLVQKVSDSYNMILREIKCLEEGGCS